MKLLITTRSESNNLVTIDVEGYKLARVLRISLSDDFSECILRLSNIVDALFANTKLIHVEVVELNLLVHKIHSCVEALLNVVLNILDSDTDFVQERGKISA